MKATSVIATVILLLLLCVATYWWSEPILSLGSYLEAGGMWGELVYVGLLVFAVVLMPLSVMPLIPIAAATLGPFTTAILSIIGWTVGAVIAFLISRYFGRPFLKHFISLDKVDNLAKGLSPKMRFWGIVVLRHTLPVDVVSYAIGLTTGVSLLEYTLATLIGVVWFSFAFAYLGDALLHKNFVLILELGLASLLIFATAWFLLQRNKKS